MVPSPIPLPATARLVSPQAASQPPADASSGALPDLILHVDAQGRLRHLQPPDARSPGPLGGRIEQILPAEAAAATKQAVRGALAQGVVQTIDFDLPVAGSGVRHFEARFSPTRDDHGARSDRCLVVVRDVTARRAGQNDERRLRDRLEEHAEALRAAKRRLEQALEERRRHGAAVHGSEARADDGAGRLHQAIDSMADGFVLWGADERLLLCNQRYRDLYPVLAGAIRVGVGFEELAWRLARCGCIREAVGCEAAWVAERMRQRRQPRIEPLERCLADGRWLRISGYRTAEGGIVTIHSDITELKRREEALRARDLQLRGIIDNLPGVVYRRLRQPDGQITFPYHSPQLARRYGLDARALADGSAPLEEAIHPDDRARWLAAIDDSARHLGPFAVDYRFRVGARDWRWVRSLATPTRLDDGSVVWDGISLDVTDLKATEQALRESEERYRRLVEAAPIALLTHRQGRIRFANARAVQLLGVASSAELEGRSLIRYVSEGDRPAVKLRLRRLRSRGGLVEPCQACLRRPDGALVDVELSAVAITEHGAPAIQVALLDVTERKRAEARVRHWAQRDALTGLPNRTLLLDRLQHALVQARRDDTRVAVMMLDLDHFKDINDTLGHPVGDQLLCAVAGRLRGAIRESDTLARFGGDEFVLIQNGLDHPGGAGVLAQKIVDTLTRPFAVDAHEVRTSTSIGIALFPEDGATAEGLLKDADMALYRAKAQGRSRFEFYLAEMKAEVHTRKELEDDLRRALERGELALVYQPQVDLHSRRLSGAEALLRWHHPERGIVLPLAFLPLAERTGLIGPIGQWVLEQACAAARAWALADTPLRVSVNLAVAQCRQADLVERVEGALERHGLSAELLDLEITEAVILDPHGGRSSANLNRLAERGVRISIDDFGTGHASLSYLRRLPIHSVKLDRSLVQGIGRDPEDEAILRAVLALGQSLGKRVIAEGVETEEQLLFLHRLGCDYAQGHLFGGSMPAAEIGRLLSVRSVRGDGTADPVRVAAGGQSGRALHDAREA